MLGPRKFVRISAAVTVATISSLSLVTATAPPALASPATVPSPVSITATGPFSGTVPDGVCAVQTNVLGGAGGSAIAAANANGSGARVLATFRVLPGQTYTGSVGGGGTQGATGQGSQGVGGLNGGGNGGVVANPFLHPGAGGGGWTELNLGGSLAVVAGGGGGSGGGHASNGGFGGNGGLPAAGGVAAGSAGQRGFDSPTATVGGGQGGQTGGPGAGGVHSTPTSTLNGASGSGRTGGNGGPDPQADSGGGGGGGYFGGGGGSSTASNGSGGLTVGGISGGGAGGGASFVAGTSPDGASTPVAAVSSSAGPKLAAAGNGANGSVQLTWVPCDYDLRVTKSVSPASAPVGTLVTWTVAVTNLGPDPMTKGDTVTLTDSLPGAGAKTITSIATTGGSNASMSSGPMTCSAAVGAAMPATLTCTRPYAAPGAGQAPTGGTRGLNSGETLTVTYQQTVTAADVPSLLNNATVDDRRTGDANDTSSATVTVVAAAPSITLDKQAGALNDVDGNGPDVGDTIAYSFVVTNTGNVSLTGIAVTDPKVTSVSCPVTTLAPAASTTCTATYTLTQADVNAGTVNNNASVSGTPPSGPNVTAADTTSTPITRTSTVTFDKQAGAITDVDGNGHDVGDTIAYNFVVTNTGNVTLTGVGVTDAKVGAVSCPTTTLSPGASTTCTATYALTQADVNSGVVNNSATVTGTPPTGVTPPTATDTTSTAVTRSSTMTLDKQAGTPSGSTVGSTIGYSFVVTNTGNVTVTSLGVTDAKVGTVSCPVTVLAPGASTTCTATYTLTQTDVDAGHVANTATVTATPPTGVTPPSETDSTDTPISAGPAITVDKQAGVPSGATAGSTIDYTFLVTNTGNVTLDPISVTDAKVGTVSCPVTVLAPGASTTCTATYTLTQADVDAGEVVNTATASGTPPTGPPTTGEDTVTTPIPAAPVITVDKQAGVPTGATAGSTIDYSFLVTNTGNVTLDSISIADLKTGPVSCPVTVLAPGESTTCTATYTLTQADVDAGHVANTATVTGTPPVTPGNPTPTPVTATDSTDTPITAGPVITLDKQAGVPTGATAGSTIDYTFLVTNTGNVTLDPISVSDAKVGTRSPVRSQSLLRVPPRRVPRPIP